MNNKTNKKHRKWRFAVILTISALILCSIVSFIIHKATLYKPLILLCYIQLLPSVVNLILLLPKSTQITKKNFKQSVPAQKNIQSVKAEETEKKADTAYVKTKEKARPGFAEKMSHFYSKYRPYILLFLILAVILTLNAFFWTHLKKAEKLKVLNYAVPVSSVVIWIAFTVLEKVCKHIGDSDNGQSNESTVKYDSALIKSLRGAIIISGLSHLLTSVASFTNIVSPWDVTKVINLILCIMFMYETIFLVISLLSRTVRKEMNTSPELNIPVPGIGGKDLSIISYLEENTGLTMRSLWSIKLIKKIIPFAVMSIVIILWMFSGVVKIESNQQGALYRLGSLKEQPLEPGLHFTLPWPFDTVDVYDTGNINRMTIGYASEENTDNLWTEGHGGEEYKLLLGGGKELVSINLRVEYKISDLTQYVKCSAAPEMILQAAAYESITDRTIRTDIETLMSNDRTALAGYFKDDLIRRSSKYDTGLEVVSVVLESIHPPVEIAEIYQQLISAEIDAEKIHLDAQSRAEVAITKANENYKFIVESENKSYFEKIAKAKEEVADFMASVEADKNYKDTYRYYKYMKAVSSAYSKGTVVIVGDGIDQKRIIIGNFGE